MGKSNLIGVWNTTTSGTQVSTKHNILGAGKNSTGLGMRLARTPSVSSILQAHVSSVYLFNEDHNLYT